MANYSKNVLIFKQFGMASLSLLLINWCFRPANLQSQAPNASLHDACVNVDLDANTRVSCRPCAPEKWFELILKQRAENDDNETNCFNNYPLGTNLPFPCPQDLTKGHPHPELDLTKTPRGFIMTKLPFFRFNIKLPSAGTCACPTSCGVNATSVITTTPAPNSTVPPAPSPPTPEDNLDVGEVEHYYFDNKTQYSVDFQVLEWPGRKTDDQRKFLEDKLTKECDEGKYKSHKPALCDMSTHGKRDFQMLKFERESSKIIHYPCNKEEGTSIIALGLMAVYEETEEDDNPHSKMYLSYSRSKFNSHGQPIYVSGIILEQMARTSKDEWRGVCRKEAEEPKNCDFTKTINDPLPQTASDCDWRQKFFEDRGDILMDKAKCEPPFNSTDPSCQSCRKVKKSVTGDLRTVLDFTFVQGRLLLGMRCGILIFSDFLNKQLNIRAAYHLSSKGAHKNTFPPINKISSSFCCKATHCRKTIVAAYSSYQHRKVSSPKELYISFDLGDTFQSKLIADPRSALNLMWGMYKLYSHWLLYYQLLENPDPEDLRDDSGDELHPGYIDLRSVPDWNSLTLAKKEKRFLYGETSSDSHNKDLKVRKRAMRKYVRLRTSGALARFVRYRRQGKEIELDLSPKWLQNEINEFRRRAPVTWRGRWTDANCDSIPACRRNFINDPAVDYFLRDAQIIVKTPKRAVEDSFCDQIMSLVVLEEEDALYVLCRVGFGDFSMPYKNNSGNPTSCSSREDEDEQTAMPDCTYPLKATGNKQPTNYAYNKCVNPIRFYAIYTFALKEKLPFVLMEERRSERLFTCKPIKSSLDWDGCKNLHAGPELIRVPNSVFLLIKNCQDVLYYSPNGGKTLFNTQFYAPETQFADLSPATVNCTQNDLCAKGPNSTSDRRQLMYRLKSLDIPPLIAISRSNTIIFMTMRNTYAYGLLGINKEFKMIVGEIFPTVTANIISKIRSNDFVFPGFTYSGRPFFGVALKLIYNHNNVISCLLYSNRHGIRLVHMDFFFYKDVSYFYEENQDLNAEARVNRLGVSVCHTYQFSVNPNALLLDVDESGTVEVKSFDPRPNIHLGLISSEEKSLVVDVSFVDRDRKEKEHLAHDWDIHVKAIRNYKPRITALVDSFFGAENNNMFGFYTEVGLANDVLFRCHVQPVATVSVHIACRDKKMVVHEDEHRPQCIKGLFSKNTFEYRLKKGEFDPNLAGYWIGLNEKEEKDLIRLDRQTGDLVIIYDYLRFGCPLEPYKDELFIPDLRIASAETKYNSSEGQLYNGSFLLIELFGATGFVFSQTYADRDCKFLPMDLTSIIKDWVTRQRMFGIAFGKQISVSDLQSIMNAKTTEELDKLEYGNQLFSPDAVDHPINIINRVTYRDCKKWHGSGPLLQTENDTHIPLDGPTVTEEMRNHYLHQPLQIQERNGENKITWSKRSQEVYIFMAIALDATESLCEYYTIFGVHLPELAEIDALITLLVFILLILLWILLFICGYMCRKRRIRTLCIELERKRRLEEAAWKVVYQYERLLQENENQQFEQEFQEFSKNAESMNRDSQKQPGIAKNNKESKVKPPRRGQEKKTK